MIRSQASAIPSAPASTCPLAAQIDGLPSSPSSRNSAREALGGEVLVHERHLGGEARPGWPPAENTFSWVEVSTTHRTVGVVARGLERGDQLAQQLVGERVARVGLVERDRRHAGVGDVVAERVVGHGRRSLRGRRRAERRTSSRK